MATPVSSRVQASGSGIGASVQPDDTEDREIVDVSKGEDEEEVANLAGTGVPAGTKYPRIAGAGVISYPWRAAGAGVSSRWRARA
jgi:hypothetical protein